MTPQVAGAFLFATGALMALNVMGVAAIFGAVWEGMEALEQAKLPQQLALEGVG